MHQSRVSIYLNVHLHSKVPLIAFLDLVHLGVSLTLFVLGPAGRCNDGGIHDGALLEHQALLGETGVDGGQHRRGQVVRLQQMAEAQDGGRIGHARCTVKAGKAAVQQPLVQFFCRSRIAQAPLRRQAVDAQHGFDGKLWAFTQAWCSPRARVAMRAISAAQGHDLVYLIEEGRLAGLLG